MILAMNIGNTNIMISVIGEDGKMMFFARLATDTRRTDDQYAIELKNILILNGMDDWEYEGGIISSVVPPLTSVLARAIVKLYGRQPIIVGPGIKTGINIRIDSPTQAGSDIVVNAVAACAKYPKPIVVIDMGTATTFAVINKTGELVGGAIMPGVRVSLDALCERTALLQNVSIETPPFVVGTNTVDSMRSGVVFGAASMVDGMVKRISNEVGPIATVVATGGNSADIVSHCETEVVHDSRLILEGLYLIYKKNT